MTRFIGEAFAWALIMFAASACGNSDDKRGGSCTAPAACGGTLDGTWQVDSVCSVGNWATLANSDPSLPASCNTLYQSITYTSESGTVTYANGTETSNVTLTSNNEVLYTQACVTALRGTLITLDAAACASIQQSAIDSGKYTSASCSYSSAGCPCTFIGQETNTDTLTYTLSGNSIVYTNGDPSADYCVSGNTMTVSVTYDMPQGRIISVGTAHR
jgi:hypothetical protein